MIYDIDLWYWRKRTPSQIWRQKTTWTILVGHQSSSTLRSPAESSCSSNRQLTDLRLGQQIIWYGNTWLFAIWLNSRAAKLTPLLLEGKKITLLDIGLALLLLLLFINLVLISVHKKRWRNWPIPSHIDGTRLVNNAYVWTEKIKLIENIQPRFLSSALSSMWRHPSNLFRWLLLRELGWERACINVILLLFPWLGKRVGGLF